MNSRGGRNAGLSVRQQLMHEIQSEGDVRAATFVLHNEPSPTELEAIILSVEELEGAAWAKLKPVAEPDQLKRMIRKLSMGCDEASPILVDIWLRFVAAGATFEDILDVIEYSEALEGLAAQIILASGEVPSPERLAGLPRWLQDQFTWRERLSR